jgi:hypothetical protein
LCFFTRATTPSSALAMSSDDRLGNRPERATRACFAPLLGAAVRTGTALGRPGPRRE